MTTLLRSVAVLILALLLTGCIKSEMNNMKHKSIILTGQKIDVEIAATPAEQQKGLGGRSSFADDQGMFFPLTKVSMPSFWMKDMKIPIDILWIFEGRVVGIESSVAADDGQHLYSPKQPVDSVLELSAGWTKRHGTLIGDRIE